MSGQLTHFRRRPTVAVVAPGHHAYWAVRIDATDGDSTAAVAEVDLRAGPYSPNLCSGGTAISSGNYSASYVAANAFDHTPMVPTIWASPAGQGVGSWIGYHFAAPVDIRAVGLRTRDDHYDQMPAGFTVIHSDDGVTWTEAWSITSGATDWEDREFRLFVDPAYTPPDHTDSPWGARRYWRLFVRDTAGSGGRVALAEIELRGESGGADLTGSGTASAYSYYSSYTPDLAFDDDVAGTSMWVSDENRLGWIQYDFGAGTEAAVEEVALTARDSSTYAPNQSPRDFDVLCSDDGATWTVAWQITGETGWSAGETRAFLDPALG
ncbi:discoidin domain-containing protein [Roseospirillum parvum]|uniref:F5/8 type C domain-containing protein n=1 Tax=Roseospirillum parvum TaxID=83401 RepID=A0A1G8EWD6_9PROT|nr:discoidin domain-containing protein [Roseospirillum parvum]SDH74029.1 F5/8 type C domain-containing protein [Roseospirillum parvum]